LCKKPTGKKLINSKKKTMMSRERIKRAGVCNSGGGEVFATTPQAQKLHETVPSSAKHTQPTQCCTATHIDHNPFASPAAPIPE
jgi:hypothetical protein